MLSISLSRMQRYTVFSDAAIPKMYDFSEIPRNGESVLSEKGGSCLLPHLQ